jgi:hypothetical protein
VPLIRSALAWTLYGLGHVWYLMFDTWLPCGMSGAIYRVYNGLMTTSHRVQGEGRGPWLPAR